MQQMDKNLRVVLGRFKARVILGCQTAGMGRLRLDPVHCLIGFNPRLELTSALLAKCCSFGRTSELILADEKVWVQGS